MTNTAPSSPVSSGAIPSLDGIRAIAVLLVFFAHSGLDRVLPGGLGVTAFFVLSGYLITTLMRIEHERNGRIDFRGFYLRRLLRLMPPLALVVALAALLSAAGLIDGRFSWAGALSALFYIGNYHLIANDFHGMPGGMGVVWSLAIEEHYYLLFPPLALLLLRDGRKALASAVMALLCAAVLGWRCWLAWHGASADYLTMATDARIDAILIGSWMALVRNPWLDPEPTAPLLPDWAVAGAALGVLAASVAWRDETFRLTLRFTLQSLAVAALMHLAVARSDTRALRWLNATPLVYIGSISYTIYLVHHMILLGLAKHWPQLGWFWLTLAGACLTLALAEPMRRWVDQPLARLRQRLHRKALHGRIPRAFLATGWQ